MGGWERSIENTKIGQRQPRAGKFTTLESTSFESTGNVVIGGDLHVTGSMIVTASVLHEGSNVFGDEATDTHKFIGVTTASGDLIINTDLHVKTNASVDGTLDVAGITHLRSNASFDSDLTVAGNIKGNMDEIIQATSDTLTAAELRGTIISNYGQGAANNLQGLPTAAEGMNFIGVCGTAQAAHYFRFQAGATDKIYLDGVAGADNGYVSIAAPVVGSCIYFFTFQTGAGVYDWYAATTVGTWLAG